MFKSQRNSGIPLVGELPWGNHFCLFYRTGDDLLDILLPYFIAGVAGNELCFCVVPEGTADDSGSVMARLRASLGEPIAAGRLAVMTCRQWQELEAETGNAVFALLDRGVIGGFDGIRVACALSSGGRGDHPAIHRALAAMAGLNVLALFAYPHDQYDAPGLMEVIRNHRCALVRKPGGWDLIQSSEARGVSDELKRNVEKLKFLFSNMSEGFAYHRIVLDASRAPCDYVFMEVNEAFEALTGLRGSDIIGKRATAVLPGIETDPADWIGRYGRVALTGEPVRFESYSVPLGKWFAVSAFSPHKGYFAVMFSDITDRKMMDEERERLLAELHHTTLEQDAIFSAVPFLIALHDRDGRWLKTNAAVTEFFGVDPATKSREEIAQCLRARFPDGTPLTPENMPSTRALRGETVRGEEYLLTDVHGIDHTLLFNAIPLEKDGDISGMVTAQVDITDRKRAEEALRETNLKLARSLAERDALMDELRRAKDAAEAATRTKSQFLANMSHELRTPMTGVLGMLELTLDGPLDALQREQIEIAHRSARSLLHILNDILDLTKVEAGKTVIEAQPFDLRACMESVFSLILPEVRRKGLELVHSVDAALPACVVGDQTRLLQVLTNLCGNAVKFTEKGWVEISVVAGGMVPDGRREIVFTVADSGIGIPDGKEGALFQPFSQVDDSNTRKYGGTGLGLAISKELVCAMGGSIAFARSDGGGSRFAFTIPLGLHGALPLGSEPSPPDLPLSGTTPGEGTRPHILLAEDDATTRLVLGALLHRLDFDLDVAEDGLRAIEMWEKGGYDLVLMDVQMPRLDGFAATRAIRARELEAGGGRHTIIVAMTAHAFEEDRERCRQAGMDDYISKPIDLKQCVARLNGLLGRGPA